MFDQKKYERALAGFKQDFVGRQWPNERYKWEAVQWFQDHWDVKAPDFAGMLSEALKKTFNLLASMNNYPRRMIVGYAKEAPEEVRAMFIALFDETADVWERIDAFKRKANGLKDRLSPDVGQHYQNENVITTYLWLRYPDKYYIYKLSEVRKACRLLGGDCEFRNGAYADNIRNWLAFFNEIRDVLIQDYELIELFREQLTATCYPDPQYRTLTQTFCFYVSRFCGEAEPKRGAEEWLYADCAPGSSDISAGSRDGDREKTAYTKASFLNDVYISEARYDRLKAVLLRKKNIILQGAPGVGKTFAARRLAWSIMGEQDDSRIEFVQFHQNYSYEDFVMGYKPEGSGFELKYGVFYRFCQKANNRPGVPHFFIIDEINRGNLSKVFGELLMLIEQDYRNTKVKLAYSDVPFSVPENLYIIGMMNTADRSLALIDYALRRRFSFFDMEPGFDSEGFGKYQAGLENETFDALIDRIRELNRDIIQDKALGKGFCIGHSYFCGLKGPEDCTTEWMRDVVDYPKHYS